MGHLRWRAPPPTAHLPFLLLDKPMVPSTAALARLAFRLAVVLVFGLAWPGEAPPRAAGILCLALAAGCFGVAWTSGEKLSGPGLNRWHEGAFLIGLAVALFSWFGLAFLP
jgi:hypothetical protein